MKAKPEAGPELDQLIAKHAMKGAEAPYSTDIDAAVRAWQRIAVRERYAISWVLVPVWGYENPNELSTLKVAGWRVMDQSVGADGQPSARRISEADTPALAISLAVWKVVKPQAR